MIYLNNMPINITLFPDNTSQVWKLTNLNEADNEVRWDFSHEGEFMQLAQLKDLIDFYGHKTILCIKYLPYGRQDKEISNSTTFALCSFANSLNYLQFDEVIIHDPHSTIALDLIKNSVAKYPIDTLQKVIEMTGSQSICYPDKGAVSKYADIYRNLTGSFFLYGDKVRDPATGNITHYELKGNIDFLCKNNKVLIVDDICDGGMTFKLLAKDLLATGAKEVNLFVTHGIFSKGLKTLRESGINRIFTQDGEANEAQKAIVFKQLTQRGF